MEACHPEGALQDSAWVVLVRKPILEMGSEEKEISYEQEKHLLIPSWSEETSLVLKLEVLGGQQGLWNR